MANDQINVFRIEKAALGLLDTYGITRPGFNIEDLAAAEELEIRRGGLKNSEAWLIRLPQGGGIIRLRDDVQEPGRIKFSIAHELGHWSLHPSLRQTFLCTASDLRDYVRSSEEIEANLFAANLLMPKAWIPDATWKRDPSFAEVTKLTEAFGTSLTAASRRFTELSRHAVVLILSVQNKVSWVLKSPAAKSLFIEYGSETPETSITRECVTNEINPTQPDIVEPHVWFPDWKFDEDAEVFEDVRISKAYAWSLTMLWVPALG